MCKFRHCSNLNHLINYWKSCVNHCDTGMPGGSAYNFDRNKGRKTFKIKWLLQLILMYYSGIESFTLLGFYALHPWLQLQRQLNYTKSLVTLLSHVVPNAQIRALKTWELDSNPGYGPVEWIWYIHFNK